MKYPKATLAFKSWFDGYKYAGGALSYDQVVSYTDTTMRGFETSFLKYLETACVIYVDEESELDLHNLFFKLGVASKGKLPTRNGYQAFHQVIIDKVDPSTLSGMFTVLYDASKNIVNDTVETVATIGETASSIAGTTLSLSKFLPYIALAGVGLYIYFLAKSQGST